MTADQCPLILHIVHRFDVGGIENGLVNLLNGLPEGEWRHAVLALTEVSEHFRRRVIRPDVHFLAMNKQPGHLHAHYPRLFRIFRELRPAIVHTRNLAALEAVVPAWAARVPVRIHGEHGRDARDPLGTLRKFQWVRRAYSPLVTKYVALSGELERYLVESVGIGQQRVVRICNGVDTRRFSPISSEVEPTTGCPFSGSDHWIVGTVGRMDPIKDQRTLALAFVRALELRPEARQRLRLSIVGDGATRNEIERILAENGVSDLAWFAGERSDVPLLMRGMNCFVLPSLGEGISNTILEAMACGLPVIATRVGGNAELVEDGASGTLVPVANTDAMALAILHYFDDPELGKTHGRAGRARVQRSFSLLGMMDSYQDVYSSSLRSAGIARIDSGAGRFDGGAFRS